MAGRKLRDSVAKSLQGNVIDFEIPGDFFPRPHQLRILKKFESGCRRFFLRWHRRAGKDFISFLLILWEMVLRPGVYYYIFPTFSDGKRIIWEGTTNEGRRFLDFILKGMEAGKDHPVVKRINHQEMMMEFHNGSIFRIIGTDGDTRLDGTNPKGIVLSEYAKHGADVWSHISPIIRLNKGWVIINSTPKGENHMYRFEQAILNSPEWHVDVMQTLWPDRPNYTGLVTPEEIQLERMTSPEGKVEQEYGVSYSAALDGAYYGTVIRTADQEGRIGTYPHNPNKLVDTFWDLGRNDFCSIWFRQVDGDTVKWIDYHEERHLDMAACAAILADKGYKYRCHYMPHDGANKTQHKKTLIQEFEEAADDLGICSEVVKNPRMAKGGKMEAISLTRSRFWRYYFNAGTCNAGLDRLRRYHARYDSKLDRYLDEPVHDEASHAADAIRIEATDEQALNLQVSEVSYKTTRAPKINTYSTDWDPLSDSHPEIETDNEW